MSSRLTPLRCSSLPRAFKCLSSTLLPAVSVETEAGERGRDRHAKLAEGRGADLLRSIPGLPEWQIIGSEVPLKAPGLSGTADLLAITEDAVIVCDYKGRADVEPAAENKQLLGYAHMACRKYERDQAWLVVIYVDDDLSVIRHDVAHIAEGQLEKFRDELSNLEARRTVGKESYGVGDWCKHCGSARFCPAQLNAFQAIAKVSESGPIEPMRLGEIYEKIQHAKRLLAGMEESIEVLAHQVPISLPNGNTLSVVEQTREEFDAEKAKDMLPPEAFDLRLTKASIKRAFGEQAGGVIAKLREAGAANVKTIESVREHK